MFAREGYANMAGQGTVRTRMKARSAEILRSKSLWVSAIRRVAKPASLTFQCVQHLIVEHLVVGRAHGETDALGVAIAYVIAHFDICNRMSAAHTHKVSCQP